MNLHITRVDQTLPMPEYATSGAVAFDFTCRETVTVAPKQIVLIPSNLIVAIPEGYVVLVSGRSSTARKKGLHVTLGVIDQDYCGPEDEIKIQAWNLSDTPVTIERGERIAQALVMPIERCQLVEKAVQTATSRGGFGTTGS